jgi:uncharacterized protein (TIGR02246 family)
VELWELSARESIRELLAAYARAADSGNAERFASLFAPDGVLEVHGMKPIEGRDAIRAFLSGGKGSGEPVRLRHHLTNVSIAVESPSAATGECYFTVFTDAGVDHWGRYRDTYVGADDDWKIAHRLARTEGRTPGGWADSRLKD